MTRSFALESIKFAALAGAALFVFVPVYFMVVISFKDNQQFYMHPFAPTFPLHPGNYAIAWEYIGPCMGRTFFTVVMATGLTTFLGSLCAFYFAQFRFTGRTVFFYYIILLMMIPGILNLIPLYVLVTQMDALLRALSALASSMLPTGQGIDLRLLNTLWVLILPAAAGGQVMMIFVLRQFFESQPSALFEAARIDGASRFQSYRHIAIPLAKPIIATMAIINVVALWNDYIWPLVVLQKDHYTLAVGLKYLEGVNQISYGPLMAGYVMSAIPLLILFLLSMRLFIQGIASGAIKM